MSGGSVEVYIEPLMPVTKITIFGRSHIAKALCEIGHAAGFGISIVSDLADDDMFPQAEAVTALKDFKTGRAEHSYVVVCTQGDHDAESLSAALNTQPKYISFVASRRKANSILMGLKREGVPHEQLVKIKTPAGLDIQAKTPQEVAISILAEIIQTKRQSETRAKNEVDAVTQKLTDDLYINPVCKIPVQKSTAKHVLEYNGEKIYFCCDGCKVSFEKEPEAYM
jgi:xanthine dehydrogenase accessory factor